MPSFPSSASWQPFFTSHTSDRALCAPCHLKSVCHCYFLPHSLASLIPDAAAHATLHPAAISGLFRLRPKNLWAPRPFYFPSSSPAGSDMDPADVADHSNVNSCWWSFPYSSAVTWLCQSGCLASTAWTAGSFPALPAYTFKDKMDIFR